MTAVAVACSPRHDGEDTSSVLYADIYSLVVCQARPVIRVRVRSIVIRIRVRHTAIRVRVVVATINHTAYGELHQFGYKGTE